MEQKVTNTNGKRIEIPARTPDIGKVRHRQKTPQKCYAPQKLDTFGGAYFYGKKGSKTEKV